MDLEKIKARREALNQVNQSSSELSAKFWKPELGKSEVRIVPSMYDKDNPFTELKFHTVISKFPILDLSNLGKQDPVEEFVKELRDKGGKENWSVAGKLTPRSRYFVPVVVRGEEDKGVRLWNIGITLYKVLLGFAADEEIGDYTDVASGFDLKVTKVKGDPYPETTVKLARKSTPLSEDAKQVEDWLNNQPKPIDCFRHPDYDYVKTQLANYFSGGTTAATTQVAEATTKAVEKVAKMSVTLPKQESEAPATAKEAAEIPAPVKPKVEAKAPKSIVSEFDELFNDVAKSSSPAVPEQTDGLPF